MTDQTILIETPLNEVLLNAREGKKLSLEAASSQLNLSVDKLRRLERDDLNPIDLTPFERGYVRNYAALLGVDKSSYEQFFPESIEVSSELHSVQRYSMPVDKPMLGGLFVKTVFFMITLAVIALLVWSVMPDITQNGLLSHKTELHVEQIKPIK